MARLTRRELLHRGTWSAATWFGLNTFRSTAFGGLAEQPRFTMDLNCGAIGVRADQRNAIRLAHKFGFTSVMPDPNFLASLSDESNRQLQGEMLDKKMAWGAAGLPIEFRRDQETFADGLRQLPRLAVGLQRAGVTRVGTWIHPAHATLTYNANFRQHAARLRAIAEILADHGLRLGLEYVGPKTAWTSLRHSFVHTMAETKELIAEIGLSNVGFVLDSWHWYTAHETLDDLRTLTNQDVIACDLNDAPAGIPIDQQIDSRRELPTATGVIDLKGFLTTLVEIGYDGPIRAEPFNRGLNKMDDEPAVAATSRAMRTAFALAGMTSP